MTRKPLSPWHTLALNNALFAAALHDICEAFGSSVPRRIREESSSARKPAGDAR